ncbi:hypothetical protein BDZ45DRAFT_746581 [Acephala macrosclerotiorum]|nr:hypothetical protein BDZ45DRAFT_746581 [Acephala macrosclerotiorum]
MSQEALNIRCRETEYHITARCACLLEVVKARHDSEITYTAPVQFLHRTVRDFLEDQDRWKEILDRTQGVLFDPHWYLMRSHSLMLHWRLTKVDFMTRRYLRDITITMLAFASRADAHTASHVHQMRILEDANKLMVAHRNELNSWHDSFKEEVLPPSIRTPLIACALMLNVPEYISSRLRYLDSREPKATRTAATYLLHSRILTNRYDSIEGLPHINFRMASVLLKFEADVNSKNHAASDLSSWGDFLNDGLGELSSPRKRLANPDFPRVMSLFLSSGADPHISLDESKHRIGLLEFFEDFEITTRAGGASKQSGCASLAPTAEIRYLIVLKAANSNSLEAEKPPATSIVLIEPEPYRRYWHRELSPASRRKEVE